MKMKTPPVLLITFRRPDLVRKQLENISQAKPVRFYVAVDAPRKGNSDDERRVAEVKSIIAEYEEALHPVKLYQAENQGCGKGVSGAITWLFEHEEEGIILEDDCYPDQSFYPYCAELLERYRNDPRVMQIAGYNRYQGLSPEYGESYRFSYHGWQWGWATWRRAWKLFDIKLTQWEECKRRGFALSDSFCRSRLADCEDYSHGRGVDTWDLQWSCIMGMHRGLSPVPIKSLVTNIGAGYACAHGVDTGKARDLGVLVEPMKFPMIHPKFVVADLLYDAEIRKIANKWYAPHKVFRRFVGRILRRIGILKPVKK